MKANAPKRKVFQDALDLLAEDPVKDTPVPGRHGTEHQGAWCAESGDREEGCKGL